MKVTITQEGLDLRKDFLLSHIMSEKSINTPSYKKMPPINASTKSDYSTLLPPIKSATEVAVKVPKIRISKEFAPKYTISINNSTSQSNLETISDKLGFGTTLTSLPVKTFYVENKLSNAISKAKSMEEISKIELKCRKLMEVYNLQLKRRQAIYERIRQARERMEADRSEKIEKFRYSLAEMTAKFEEKLLIDTRKVRKKDRVAKFHCTRYGPSWTESKVNALSIPKKKERKFIEL